MPRASNPTSGARDGPTYSSAATSSLRALARGSGSALLKQRLAESFPLPLLGVVEVEADQEPEGVENARQRFVVAVAAERPLVERVHELGSLDVREFDASDRAYVVLEGGADAAVGLHMLKPANERVPDRCKG